MEPIFSSLAMIIEAVYGFRAMPLVPTNALASHPARVSTQPPSVAGAPPTRSTPPAPVGTVVPRSAGDFDSGESQHLACLNQVSPGAAAPAAAISGETRAAAQGWTRRAASASPARNAIVAPPPPTSSHGVAPPAVRPTGGAAKRSPMERIQPPARAAATPKETVTTSNTPRNGQDPTQNQGAVVDRAQGVGAPGALSGSGSHNKAPQHTRRQSEPISLDVDEGKRQHPRKNQSPALLPPPSQQQQKQQQSQQSRDSPGPTSTPQSTEAARNHAKSDGRPQQHLARGHSKHGLVAPVKSQGQGQSQYPASAQQRSEGLPGKSRDQRERHAVPETMKVASGAGQSARSSYPAAGHESTGNFSQDGRQLRDGQGSATVARARDMPARMQGCNVDVVVTGAPAEKIQGAEPVRQGQGQGAQKGPGQVVVPLPGPLPSAESSEETVRVPAKSASVIQGHGAKHSGSGKDGFKRSILKDIQK